MRSLPARVVIVALASLASGHSLAAAEPKGKLAENLSKATFDHYSAAPGYSEGPTWRGGDVFFCSGALLRVDAEKRLHTHLDLGPAGTVLRADGHLVVADNKYKAVLDVSPDGKVAVLADQFRGQPLRSLNDLTVDARGNVYWTDPEGSTPQTPVGQIFRLSPDGRVDCIGTGLAFPNGLDVDPASEHLYVIESQSKKVLRYKLPDDRDLLGPPEMFYDLGGSGGDGCAFDAEGNLWVADFHRPETEQGRITVLNPQAEVLAYLNVPAKVVSNIAFGGKNHDEIFCTTGDPPGVFHASVGVKGFAGHAGKPMTALRTLNIVVRRTHADADLLKQIAKAATESDADKQIAALLPKLTDAQVRADMEKQLPDLKQAAAHYAKDQPLLAEVKRLNGKATSEVFAPDWLRAIAGDDSLAVFGRIVELNLNERTDGHKEPDKKPLSDRVTDEWLARVADQRDLRRLEVSGTAVTSAGLAHVKDLTNLESLNVCLTAVDDQGLTHLANLTKLRRATVCSSKVTGSGFASCAGMKQLESINLHSSPASDEGLAAIAQLTSLQRLEIVHTNVTDVGLAHLASLVNLRQLHIHGPKTTATALPFLARLDQLYEFDVYDQAASNETLAQAAKLPKLRMLRFFSGTFDDAGVKPLTALTSLEDLVLDSPKLTDAGLDHLAGMKHLRTLHLGGKITAEGKQRLQAMLPQVRITP